MNLVKRNYRILLCIIFLTGIFSTESNAQVAINTSNSAPDNSAMLDVSSTSMGILIPRMTAADRNTIASPATGLMVFQTDNTSGFYYYNGTAWEIVGSGASSINDLSDGKYVGYSVYLGEDSGVNDDGTPKHNTAAGRYALYSNTSGYYNTSIGNTSSYWNTSGNSNTVLGYQANFTNQEGSKNTIIGYSARKGSTWHNKSGCVFIGYAAGVFEETDNKLYIENTQSTTPLIYGDFDLDLVRIIGDFEVTGNFSGLSINSLSDGKTGGQSVFLGLSAGANDDGSTNRNVGNGNNALLANTTGYRNIALGYRAVSSNTSGYNNSGMGYYALFANTTGRSNVAVGYYALYSNTTPTIIQQLEARPYTIIPKDFPIQQVVI